MNFPQNRRKQILVNKPVQLKINFVICILAAFFLIFFGGLTLMFHKMNYEFLLQEFLTQTPELYSQLENEFQLLSLSLLGSIALSIILIFTATFFIHHKTAGPVYATVRNLKEFSSGNGRPLKLRERDQFQELEKAYNDALFFHQKKVLSLEKQLKELSSSRFKHSNSQESLA